MFQICFRVPTVQPSNLRSSVTTSFWQFAYEHAPTRCIMLGNLTGALQSKMSRISAVFQDIELQFFVQVHLTMLSIASQVAFAENGRKRPIFQLHPIELKLGGNYFIHVVSRPWKFEVKISIRRKVMNVETFWPKSAYIATFLGHPVIHVKYWTI